MSELLEIKKQLGIANQQVAQFERALAEHPTLPSVAANLDSAVRIQKKLELQFSETAEALGYEICTYRSFDENNNPKVAASFEAIALFQKLVSVVYGAQKYKEKSRATISAHVERETAFGFGYAFTGSIGVVLTSTPEQKLIEGFKETDLDEAIDTAFGMVKAKSASDIKAYAKKLGSGPVHALYTWVNQNAENGLGADIEWNGGRNAKMKVFVQRQQLSALRKTIERTSSEEVIERQFEAMLTMADVTKNRFKFREEGMPVHRGSVEPGVIDDKHRVGLPQRYQFKVRITTTTKFSTGESKVRYHLLKITKPKGDNHVRKNK